MNDVEISQGRRKRMNVKFSTKFVAASAAAVMALSLAGCSGGSI